MKISYNLGDTTHHTTFAYIPKHDFRNMLGTPVKKVSITHSV